MSKCLGVAEENLSISFDEKVSDAALWVELITNRAGPCRCLNCESTELVDQRTGEIVIVPSRGIFRIKFMGMCSRNDIDRYYTTEGIRLFD